MITSSGIASLLRDRMGDRLPGWTVVVRQTSATSWALQLTRKIDDPAGTVYSSSHGYSMYTDTLEICIQSVVASALYLEGELEELDPSKSVC